MKAFDKKDLERLLLNGTSTGNPGAFDHMSWDESARNLNMAIGHLFREERFFDFSGGISGAKKR